MKRDLKHEKNYLILLLFFDFYHVEDIITSRYYTKWLGCNPGFSSSHFAIVIVMWIDNNIGLLLGRPGSGKTSS